MVLDAYAGTLTTAIACLDTDRSCIAIEEKNDCYNLVLKRLERVTDIKNRSQGLQDGSNPDITAVTDLLTAVSSHTSHSDNEVDKYIHDHLGEISPEDNDSEYEGSENAGEIAQVNRTAAPSHDEEPSNVVVQESCESQYVGDAGSDSLI